MRSHPTTNEPQEIPGPSRMPSQQTTSAPKRTRADFEASNKSKKRNSKKETTNTKWSKEKVIKLATKNQREQQHPKGSKKTKEQTQHSSPKL